MKVNIEGSGCDECPKGTFAPPNSTSCSPCKANEVAQRGSPTCTLCGEGEHPDANRITCLRCLAEEFSLTGTSCTPCPGATAKEYDRGATCEGGLLSLKEGWWWVGDAITGNTSFHRCVQPDVCVPPPRDQLTTDARVRCAGGTTTRPSSAARARRPSP